MSTSTRELTINTIVRRAYQLAGLMNPGEGEGSAQFKEKAAMARDFLELIVDDLQTEGIFVRSVDFYTLTLVKGQEEYTLPLDTLDLHGSAMYLDPNQTTGETMVTMIPRESYQRLSNKTAQGRPYLYYPNKVDSKVEVFLWPVPDQAGTIRFQRRRLLADNTDGNATIDLERYWAKYIVWELAHHLATASSLEPNRCGYLANKAEKALKKAKGYARQRPPTFIHLTHSSGSMRRR